MCLRLKDLTGIQYDDNLIDAAGIVLSPDGVSIRREKLESADQYDEEVEAFLRVIVVDSPAGRC
jgi:hypothetical protein